MPGWSEIDHLKYREYATANALQQVYDVVKLWTSGKITPDVARLYAILVGQGVVGKDV